MAQAISQNSNRLLIILFVVSVCLFSVFRWDSSAWLSEQVKQAGFDLTHDSLRFSGSGLHFDNLKVTRANMQPVSFQSLQASLSIGSLFTGTLAANIDAYWESNPISFSATQEDENISLTNIDAVLDASSLGKLMPNVPAQLSGIVSLQGNLLVNSNSQRLQAGNLTAVWNQAKAGLASPEFTLGDYQIKLYSDEDTSKPWHWDINGGSGVALKGSGTLSPQNPDPKNWRINGTVSINIDNTNPSLSMMMQSMMGGTQANLRISGSLGAPRTDIVR